MSEQYAPMLERVRDAATWLQEQITPEEFDRFITQVRREAWTDGARWAAVECGAIPHEGVAWLAPGDNPHDKEA